MDEEINIERFKKEDFLSKEITSLVTDLNDESKPKWGIMTAQHMLEHLEGSFKISNGEIELTETRHDEDVVKKRKIFLMSEEPFGKNIQVGSGKLKALKYGSVEEAKINFFKQLIAFFGYHDKNKDKVLLLHPAFGNLTYEEWLQFHYKHVNHHFMQFKLISE